MYDNIIVQEFYWMRTKPEVSYVAPKQKLAVENAISV
jgi:hypothetical protein